MTTAATDHLVQLAVATGVELAGDCLDQPAGRRLVLERIAARLGMDSVALTAVSVPADLSRIVSRSQVVRYRLLPLARTEAGLRVAVADPLDCDGLDGLSHQLGLSLEPVLADARELAEAIERCYGASGSLRRAGRERGSSMSDLILNIRFFYWHLQISEKWQIRFSYNSYHRTNKLAHGWIKVYQFGEHFYS